MKLHLLCCLAGSLSLAPVSPAQVCESRLLGSDLDGAEAMGSAVYLGGELCVSGAPGERDPSTAETLGAVYVHVQASQSGDWTQTAKLQPSGLVDQDRFGTALAFHDGILCVGAPNALSSTTETGSVYLYETADGGMTWSQLDALVPSDGLPADLFGQSVAIDGDWILVGAPGHDLGVDQAGSVYVFQRSGGTWVETQKLTASVPDSNDQFGDSLSMDGTGAAVGASRRDGASLNSGQVAIFRRTAGLYALEQPVFPTDGAIADLFGTSVCLSGDLLVCGAPGDDDMGNAAGSVYAYRQISGAWILEEKLFGSAIGASSSFGSSVSSEGDTVGVGAPGDPGGGGAYIFLRTGAAWSEQRSVRPIFQASSSSSGTDVCIDAGRLALGDAGDDSAQFNTGATFLVAIDGVDANGDGVTDICQGFGTAVCAPAVANSTGAPGVIDAYGSPFAGDRLLEVEATGLPNLQFGYFLASQTSGLVVEPGGSQGNLCLGGAIGRFILQVENTGFTGSIRIPIDTANMPAPLVATVSAGQSWLFQAWYRDANPMPTSNFTNAIQVAFQ